MILLSSLVFGRMGLFKTGPTQRISKGYYALGTNLLFWDVSDGTWRKETFSTQGWLDLLSMGLKSFLYDTIKGIMVHLFGMVTNRGFTEGLNQSNPTTINK